MMEEEKEEEMNFTYQGSMHLKWFEEPMALLLSSPH